MKIECQRVGTVEVLAPIGALVDEDAEQFRRSLLDHLQSPNPRLVVAMGEIPYMDSVALEALLDASDALSERASVLRLADVPPNCREVLELTGTAGRFRFFKTANDAVKSYL